MTDQELLIATAKATQTEEWQEMWLDKNPHTWPWNPFKYKGDAFALIEKYLVEIAFFAEDDEWSTRLIGPERMTSSFGLHNSLAHSICLAIVEANSD